MKKKLGVILGVVLVAVMLTAVLVGCVPSDPAKAAKNLEDEGYKVINVTTPESMAAYLESVEADKVKAVVVGTKADVSLSGIDMDTVILIYFKDAASAKDYYAKIKEAFDELSDKDKENADFGISGSVVYSGTKAAVKAAK